MGLYVTCIYKTEINIDDDDKGSHKKNYGFSQIVKKGGAGHLQSKLLLGKKFASRGGVKTLVIGSL